MYVLTLRLTSEHDQCEEERNEELNLTLTSLQVILMSAQLVFMRGAHESVFVSQSQVVPKFPLSCTVKLI